MTHYHNLRWVAILSLFVGITAVAWPPPKEDTVVDKAGFRVKVKPQPEPPVYTIDDVQSSWRDFIGKTIRVQVSQRDKINQLGGDLWEVNLWHKSRPLYCHFSRDLFEDVKDIWTENAQDIPCFYLIGTISEATLQNFAGRESQGPCFRLLKRLR